MERIRCRRPLNKGRTLQKVQKVIQKGRFRHIKCFLSRDRFRLVASVAVRRIAKDAIQVPTVANVPFRKHFYMQEAVLW